MNNFMKSSFHYFSIPSLHMTGASDFANPDKGGLSDMNFRSPGPLTGQTIAIKIKCRIHFFRPYLTTNRLIILSISKQNGGHTCNNSSFMYPFE